MNRLQLVRSVGTCNNISALTSQTFKTRICLESCMLVRIQICENSQILLDTKIHIKTSDFRLIKIM